MTRSHTCQTSSPQRTTPTVSLLAPPSAGAAHATAKPESLIAVIERLPARCYERSNTRAFGLVLRDLVMYAAVLWLLISVDTWWISVLLWIPAGFVVSALFVLGHDAAHDSLFDSKRLNSIFSRILFFPSLHLTGAWKLGHNHIHHRHTARQQMDFVWHPTTPDEWASMSRVKRARHRLDWSLLGPGFYYLTDIWWRKMVRLSPPERYVDEVRFDRRIMTGWLIGSVGAAGLLGGLASGDVLGAAWMAVKLIGGPFFVFCWCIGWVVYVHHINVRMPWATRRSWNKVDAQLRATAVFRLPKLFDNLWHKIFVHVPHHVDVRIPCYRLDEAQRAIEANYPGLVLDEKLTVRSYVSTVRNCKLFDFDAQVWRRYP